MIQIMYIVPKTKDINTFKVKKFNTYFAALKFISCNIDKVLGMNISRVGLKK